MGLETKTELRIAPSDLKRAHEIFFDDMEDMVESEDMPDGTITAHMDELEFAHSEEEDQLAAEGIPFVLFHSGPSGVGKSAFDGAERARIVTGEQGGIWLRVEIETGEPHTEMAASARHYCAVERGAIEAMIIRGR